MKKSTLYFTIISIILFCAKGVYAQPGYVNTIVGNGTSGFSGDGGPALSAKVQQVLGSVVVDNSGNIYFPDCNNYRIRKVTPMGIISTIAGGGSSTADGIPATSASLSLNAAGTIAMNAVGDIYFADGNRIRKITMSTGILNTVVGTGTGGYSGDGGPAISAELNYPVGICFDASGNLYIGDETNVRVRKVNTAGIISTFAGTGTSGFSGDGGLATAAELKSPDGVCVDAAGNLYVADRYNYRIRKIDTTGIITTYAGSGSSGFCGDGGAATSACFFEPSNVRIDAYGNLYISDFHNGRIRMVNTSGIVSTFAGGGTSTSSGIPATSESFTDVWGIGMDKYNNIYVPDRNDYRICRVGPGFPSINADSFSIAINTSCTGLNFEVITHSYSSGQHVKTYFGNGSSFDTAVTAYGVSGICSFSKSYLSGTYTIKHVLYDGPTAVDSIAYSQTFSSCQNFTVKFYVDENADCIKESSEPYFFQNITTEVDSNSIAIDTVISTSGFNYLAYGTAGTVYSFKVLSTPSGMHISCPSTGMIKDTLLTGTESLKYMGLTCDTTGNFDLAVHAIVVVSGIHDQWGHIYVSNSTCYAPNATLTVQISPIYEFSNAIPVQTSVSGNTVTWNIDTLTAHTNHPLDIIWGVAPTYPGSAAPGDTTHTSFKITPYAGDIDTTNNAEIIVDTVKAGCDPNEIMVSPRGCINTSGSPLQYTLHFENTGNDTAYNIYVMDTLSPYVDPSSMQIVAVSAEMYITKLAGPSGQTILKFDFPGINLLDSSYQGLCDGAVIFNINTKPGLANGTDIYNRAGVYFDYNGVVMTNQVDNVVGCGTTATSNTQPVVSSAVVYPNPASDVLTIQVDNKAFQSYIISNSIGETFQTNKLIQSQTEVNIKALPPGLYFVNIIGEQGSVVRKFVKI